jgi:hypothetical protein
MRVQSPTTSAPAFLLALRSTTHANTSVQYQDACSCLGLVLDRDARAAHARSDPASPRPCHQGPGPSSPLAHTCCASKRSRTRVVSGRSVQRWPRKTRTRDRRGQRANGHEWRPPGGNFDRRARIRCQNHDPIASCGHTSDSQVVAGCLGLGVRITVRPTSSTEPALASRYSTMHRQRQQEQERAPAALRGHTTPAFLNATPYDRQRKTLRLLVLPVHLLLFRSFAFLLSFL